MPKASDNMIDPFDLESVYDEQISPLMAQIIEICKANGLPMFFSALYKYDPLDEETEYNYCTSIVNNIEKRHCAVLQRCNDLVHNGLPEDRIESFAITVTQEPPKI